MCATCAHAAHMSVMIQIRNVPDELHRVLKSRAALAAMSLSDYLLAEMRQMAERPTIADLRARLAALPPVATSISPAEAVRMERDRN
jgi:plasmid stability protein